MQASVDLVKAGIDIAKSVRDIANDLLDAIPIFGALATALVDFVTDLSTAGDLDDIKAQIEDPDFRIEVYCHLYCTLREIETYGPAAMNTALSELVTWSVGLPPSPPYITFYGQAFALFLATVSDNVAWKHAAIHLDELSDDCIGCGCGLADCPSGSDWVWEHDFEDGAGPFTIYKGTLGTGGVLGIFENSGSKHVLEVYVDFASTEITQLKAIYTAPGQSGSNGVMRWLYVASGTVTNTGYETHPGTGLAYIKTFDVPAMTEADFALNSGDSDNQVYLRSIQICGKGTQPAELT